MTHGGFDHWSKIQSLPISASKHCILPVSLKGALPGLKLSLQYMVQVTLLLYIPKDFLFCMYAKSLSVVTHFAVHVSVCIHGTLLYCNV